MIFITGGLGFIGSHTAALFAQKGTEVVILDNLANSQRSVLDRLHELADPAKFIFYEGDVRDKNLLRQIFLRHSIETVIHMAALKSVKDSFEQRDEYESVNVGGTEILLEVMEEVGCRNIIFSSSATVYGNAAAPLSETTQTGVGLSNPYGETKWAVEQILKARSAKTTPTIRSVILRYFNPVGAHPSGLLGESPNGTPNNLFPVMLRAIREGIAATKDENSVKLTVFGDDYPTRDGTCVRDYIDIQDLAEAHWCAAERFAALAEKENPFVCNVGTGRGTSVLELLDCFRGATGVQVPYKMGPRRDGDLGELFAAVDPERTAALGWAAVHTLEESCKNAWLFANT